MEELQGGKLADGLKNEMRIQAAREGKMEQQYLADMKQKEAEAKEKGKELVGPTADEYAMYISILDKQRRLMNGFRLVHNWTIGMLPFVQKKEIEKKSDLPINHAKMIDDILLIHGHEILVDGYWNGDPHPGNLLLLRKPDGNPQIGLIDYGQVKRLDKDMRHLFAKLMIALDDDNKDEVVRLMIEAGMRTKKMDPEVIFLYAKVGYDLINDQILKGKHVQMFMEDLEAKDPIVQLPREFLMASRCSLIIRGLAQALHQNRSVAKMWRPIAERVLREDI